MDQIDELHPNSHIVYIRRASMFASSSRKELDEYFAESHRGVGSYFQKGGMRTATGLSFEEENLLMPEIINIPATDRDFRKEVTTFFQNLETKVPAHKTDAKTGVVTGGKALEIGLRISNTNPVTEENMPIEVEHFIRWRHAMGHPQVAMTEAEGNGSQLKSYYIYDPEEVSLDNLTINDAKDKALTAYLSIKDKPRSVLQYLTLLGINTTIIKKGEEAIKLRDAAEKKPEAFLKIVNDTNKEYKYLIEEMVNHGILTRVGNRLVNKDGEVIGRDITEAVLYLKDSHNTKAFVTLKAQLQDKWKNKSISMDSDDDLSEQDKAIAEEAKASTLAEKINLKKAEAAAETTTLEDVE